LSGLDSLLKSLQRQKLSKELFEVILIDDHSEDSGFSKCKEFISENELQNYHVFTLPNDKSSKKHAIREGLKKAKYDWILQTDADCRHSENWVKSFMEMIEPATKFITGPVLIKGKGLLGKLMEIESWALIAITALGIFRKSPQMSNAANMLWNKKSLPDEKLERIYESEIQSGDDQFLMNAFASSNSDSLAYNWSKNALVVTDAADNLHDFITQRIRWASKWKNSESITQWLFPAFLWLYHLLHVVLTVIVLVNGLWLHAIVLLAIKGACEFSLLNQTASKFDYRVSILPFLFLQLIYSPYVVLFGLLSQFAKQKWK
jgi:glycosyltransferase involved in cell wall biosynthesis